VRIPRVITFAFGAACGGVAVYISDATHGERRRRSAMRDVTRFAGRVGMRTGARVRVGLSEFGTVTRDTFIQTRAEHRSVTSPRSST